MSKSLVITTPDPRLRQISDKVTEIDDEIHDLIARMRQACLDWEKDHPHELSAAIAAPQLGVNKRVIIVREDLEDRDNTNYTALINPEITKLEGKTTKDYEGCLSVPFIYGLVPRPDKVRVKATLEDGNEIRLKTDGFLGRTLQHEIDHLDGILFIDHIKNNPKAFFRMTDAGDLEPVDFNEEIRNNPSLWD